MATGDQDIKINSANTGLHLNTSISQIPQGKLTFAMNAVIEGFDGEKVTYQNELGNVLVETLPQGYNVIGKHSILEENVAILWLVDESGNCEIGVFDFLKEVYSKVVNAQCLNLDRAYPILNTAHRKTNCGTEVYWVDGRNRARFIQLNNLPYSERITNCKIEINDQIDCNKLNLQPDFEVPNLEIRTLDSGGSLITGTYQFAVQYANALGEAYTSYYSVTNPISLHDSTQATQDFNFPISRALEVIISNIDNTGIYDYINLAVVKTINNISSVELVDTFKISGPTHRITYSGQGKSDIRLSTDDIFQRYSILDAPSKMTTVQDVLMLADLKTEERVSYQRIANNIKLYWQTKRLSGKDTYKKSENTLNFKGYMRDEVYPFSIVFGLDNGYITDHFPLIGRASNTYDLDIINNDDVILSTATECTIQNEGKPRWQVYNTGSVLGKLYPDGYDSCYEGDWEYGEFAYWESTEKYSCNTEIWGDLADQPIRHFKFPDSTVTHIHDDKGYVYPIGVRVDPTEISRLIQDSDLNESLKSRIKWFKIVRGNRSNNISIVAKGLITNVLKYSKENNIINATSGDVDDSVNSAETTVDAMLSTAIDYIDKAGNESQAFSGLILGLPGLGSANRKRMEDLGNDLRYIRQLDPSITEESVTFLEERRDFMNLIIRRSSVEVRGKSHIQAAQAVLDGVIDIMKAQLEIQKTLADTPEISQDLSESNKFGYFPNYLFNDVRVNGEGRPSDFFLDNTIIDEDSKYRYCLHSPDTSFYQPQLGRILKLETAELGTSSGHLVEVKNHSKYQFISTTGYITALLAGVSIGFASGSYGIGSINIFNGEAAFSSYRAFLEILYKTVPFKNFAHQWNAVGKYEKSVIIPNNGNKQRLLDISTYISPGMLNVGDNYVLNNYQRESSVYLRTTKPLPYTHDNPGVFRDSSKLVGGITGIIDTPISSYYASLKNDIVNQYGGIGDYEIIDTGFQASFAGDLSPKCIFGGDVFINKFAYKSKFPFFIDHRVGFPNAADISYNELSNVGRVKYWFSTDVKTNSSIFNSFFATMTHRFFWPKIEELTISGKIFLFAYGIPYYFCESTVNVDMRQASNNKEGDFYPRASSGIPDDWLQESEVSINNDNIYFYNKTFSKQNKETFFSNLPIDYNKDNCRVDFPYRGVFSEPNKDSVNPSARNNWRIFKPSSKVDFPQNYGALIALDGIENKQVLARFENKTLLYNALYTAPTNAGQIYMGKPLFSEDSLPLDFAETDLGHIGCQHRMLIKTEFGHVTVDAKRGSIFLFQGNSFKEITTEEVSNFFTNNLSFSINDHFSEIDTDNHFLGIGLHGVYDNRFSRLIITKLDYEPKVSGITYKDGKFYVNSLSISLNDPKYFKNKSFTVSYNFKTGSWISFHSYLPNYYIGYNGKFYSNNKNQLWSHSEHRDIFNNYYGKTEQYIIEYPFSSGYQDEILQGVKDYSRVLKVDSFGNTVQVDDVWFNKAILYNPQQCSGILNLEKKPKNNLRAQLDYPKYYTDSKTIFYTKSDNFYNYNTFWSLIRDKSQSIFKLQDGIFPELNQSILDYSKRSFGKEPIRGKNLKIRHILDNNSEHQIISEFLVAQTRKSWK